MKLRLVTRSDEFIALQPAWNRLYRNCIGRSPFLSHEWFDAAWQWCRLRGDLYIMCCERDAELVGVLPLFRPRAVGGITSRKTLEFLAVPDTQHCDIIVAALDRAEVVAVLARELRDRQADWDVLRFRALTENAIALTALSRVLADGGMRHDIQAATANPWIALDSPWIAYYATRTRGLKKAMNLATNRLARSGALSVQWLAPASGKPADVDRVLDRIITISAKSWKSRTGNSLDNAGPQAFIRRLSHHAHRLGWLSTWILALDDAPIAMEYQLVAEGDVFALRSDFDGVLEDLSPGSYLSRHMLEGLFDRGLKRYFMGPGDNAYKYRWADVAQPVYTMSVYGRSARGRALAVWDLALRPMARRLRDHIHPNRDAMERSSNAPVRG
jgi:CelD/BcsL family acetyltransferase involved in cellulose biosynthesis